jgi:uncharacterized protein
MAIYQIKVIPNAKKSSVTQEGELWKVHLSAPAVEGKANEALLEVLARHFGVKKRSVSILRGHKARLKLIEIREFS